MSDIRSSKRKRAVDGEDAASTVTSRNQTAQNNLNSNKTRKNTSRKSIENTEQDGIEVEQRVISLRSKEITTPLHKKLRRATKRIDEDDHDVSVATTITENEVLESDEEAWEGMDVESVSASDTEISTPAKRLYRRESSAAAAVPLSARKSARNRESDSILAETQPTPQTRRGRRSTPFIHNTTTESRDDASHTTSASRSSARLALSARAKSGNSSTALVAPQTRASTSRLSRWGRRAELAAVPNHERSAPQNAPTVPIHSLPLQQEINTTSKLGEAVDSASPVMRRSGVLVVLVLAALIGYLWAAGGRGALQSVVRKFNVPIQRPSIAVRLMETPAEGASALELLIKQTYQELAMHRDHISEATASAEAVRAAWNQANASRTAKLQEDVDSQRESYEALLVAVRGLDLVQEQVAAAKDAFGAHIAQEQEQVLQLGAQDVAIVDVADFSVKTQLLPNLTAATAEAGHLHQAVSDELLKLTQRKTQLHSYITPRNLSTIVSSPVSEMIEQEHVVEETGSIALRAAELLRVQLEEAHAQLSNPSLAAHGSEATIQQVRDVYDRLNSTAAVLAEQKLLYEQASLSYIVQQKAAVSASMQLEAEKYALEQQNHSLVTNTTNIQQESSYVDLSPAESEDVIKSAAAPAQERGIQRLRIEIENAHADRLSAQSENLAQQMEGVLSERLDESAQLDHQRLQRAASSRIPRSDLSAASSQDPTDLNNMATVHDFALGARGGRAVHHRSLCPADGGLRLTSHPVGGTEDAFGGVATSVVAPFKSLLSALTGGKNHKRGELPTEHLPSSSSKSKVSAAGVNTIVSHSRPRHDVFYTLPHEDSAAPPLSVAEDSKHGQVTVVLLVPVSLTAIKLVHATPPGASSLPDCAPRSVQLWGWTEDPTKVRRTVGRLVDLGAHYLSEPVVSDSYLTEANAETTPMGAVLEQAVHLAADGVLLPLRAVTVQVLNNHGESSFSCIHRLQVLGTLEEQ